MMACLALAVYFYIELKKSKQQVNNLEIALQEAQDKLATIPQQDSAEIADLKNTIALLEELKNANTETIVKDLQEKEAEKRKTEEKLQAQYEKQRATLIQHIFTAGNSNEGLRKEAYNDLLRDYREDPQLAKRLLNDANANITLENKESIWQAIDLLLEISKTHPENLKPHAATLNELFEKVRSAGLARPGGKTDGDIKAIQQNIG